jgi:hypothetical protein
VRLMLPVAEQNPINNLRPVLAIGAAVGAFAMPAPMSALLASFSRDLWPCRLPLWLGQRLGAELEMDKALLGLLPGRASFPDW